MSSDDTRGTGRVVAHRSSLNGVANAVQLVLGGGAEPLRRQTAPAAFARHETFYPRSGWLKKGFDAASVDPMVFLRDDAPLRLGVGKNMARSIRYWCHAFKLL